MMTSSDPEEKSPTPEEEITLESLFAPRPPPLKDTPIIEDVTIDEPLYPMKYACERLDLKCGDCGAPMRLRQSSKYPKPFYGCTEYPACRGAHGAHADGRPLGVPANKATKRARVEAHIAFDHMWKTKKMRRQAAYAWIQTNMKLPEEAAHIGCFTIEQCDQLIALVRKRMHGNMPSLRTAWDRLTKGGLFDEEELVFPLDEEPH